MNGQAKDDPSLPLPSLKNFPRNPAKPLSFWYIKSHDRRTLKEYILPYMVELLPGRHLMRAILERHPWANHLVNPQDMTALRDRVRQISTSFWKDPATVTSVLLQLTRMWFFSLVRYIYRIRYFEGHQTLLEDADLQDIHTQENQMYTAKLSEDIIYRLTCVQNKYGASYYRSCYKHARSSSGWTHFCKTIGAFCRSIEVHTTSNDPEESLEDVQRNLTSITLQRRCSQIVVHLEKNNILACTTRRDIQKLHDRNTSSNKQHQKDIDRAKQEVVVVQQQIDNLRLVCAQQNATQQPNAQLSTQLETVRKQLQADISKLQSTVVSQPKKHPDQLLTSLKQQIEDLDAKLTRSHAATEDHRFTAEDLATCRWLLEHLPGGPWVQGRAGLKWGQYWHAHWTRCRLATTQQQHQGQRHHPIWQLARDERFHKVGKELYATLSDRLHKYGALRGDALQPDVQRVVDAIKPVHFHGDGKVDLQAEKGRWLV